MLTSEIILITEKDVCERNRRLCRRLNTYVFTNYEYVLGITTARHRGRQLGSEGGEGK